MITPLITDNVKLDTRIWVLYKIVAGSVTFNGRLFQCEMRNRPPFGVHLLVPTQDMSLVDVKLLTNGKGKKAITTKEFVRRSLIHEGWFAETIDIFRHGDKSVLVTSMSEGEVIQVFHKDNQR